MHCALPRSRPPSTRGHWTMRARGGEIGFLGRLGTCWGRPFQRFVVDLDHGQVRFFLVVVLFGRLALCILFVGRLPGNACIAAVTFEALPGIEGSVFVRQQLLEADLLLKLGLPVLVLDDDLKLQGVGNVHAGVEVVVEVGVAEARASPVSV